MWVSISFREFVMNPVESHNFRKNGMISNSTVTCIVHTYDLEPNYISFLGMSSMLVSWAEGGVAILLCRICVPTIDVLRPLFQLMRGPQGQMLYPSYNTKHDLSRKTKYLLTEANTHTESQCGELCLTGEQQINSVCRSNMEWYYNSGLHIMDITNFELKIFRIKIDEIIQLVNIVCMY